MILHRIAGGITVALLFSGPGAPFGRDSYRGISWHIEDRSARVLRRVLLRSGRLFGLLVAASSVSEGRKEDMTTADVWSQLDREAKDAAIGAVSSVCVIGTFVAPGMPVLLPGALTLEGSRSETARPCGFGEAACRRRAKKRGRDVWPGMVDRSPSPARGERIRSRAPSSRWRGGVASSHRGMVDPG